MVNDSFDDLKMFLKINLLTLYLTMHGEGGEDGKVQSYLDKLNISIVDLTLNLHQYHSINILQKYLD